MNAKEYLEQLAQAAALPDDVKATFLKVASENEKFAKSLEEGVMLRSDYSRQSDATKAEKDKTTAYYNNLVQWKATEQAKLDALYAGGDNGSGNGHQPIQQVAGDFIPKKDFEEAKKQQEALFINLLKTTTKLQGQHYKEFGEPLPVDDLEALAVKENLSLDQAWQKLTAPRRTELQQKQFAEQLKQAEEKGARDFASTHKIPLDSQPREYHVIADADLKKQVEYDPAKRSLTQAGKNQLREGFLTEWNAAPAGTSGT